MACWAPVIMSRTLRWIVLCRRARPPAYVKANPARSRPTVVTENAQAVELTTGDRGFRVLQVGTATGNEDFGDRIIDAASGA